MKETKEAMEDGVPITSGLSHREHEGVAVRLESVSKIYGSQRRERQIQAVDNVSFECREGEFVSILGPSGCGKSTILLMVAGLLPQSSGNIYIDEQPVNGAYTDVGIVFQDPVLLPWRRVIDNVTIQGQLRKLPRNKTRERALALLGSVGLGGFEDRYPLELSGGMQQRVAICRALLHDPPLLLMDEPFGAIDALTRDQLNLDLQEIWAQSPKTVLFVTHSIPEAVLLSDRVIVMSPRPAKIAAVIEIDLPRPRGLRIKAEKEFVMYEQSIWDVFATLGVLQSREDFKG